MSVVKTVRIPKARTSACLHYLFGGDGDRVAGYASDLGDQAQTIQTCRDILAPTSRRNGGLHLIQSFPADELDTDNPDHVALALHSGRELALRVSPDSPSVTVVHVDAKGGHLHSHTFILNHDLMTGKANRDDWTHKRIARENDQLMQELGLQVCERGARTVDSPHLAPSPDFDALDFTSATTRDEVRASLRTAVDLILDREHERIHSLTDLSTVAGEYGISVAVKPDRGHGETVTIAAIDDDGKTLKNDTMSKNGKPRRISVAQKGAALGAAYTAEGLTARIAERQRQKTQEQEKGITSHEHQRLGPSPTPRHRHRPDPTPTPSTAPVERPRRPELTPDQQAARARLLRQVQERERERRRRERDQPAHPTLASRYLRDDAPADPTPVKRDDLSALTPEQRRQVALMQRGMRRERERRAASRSRDEGLSL